MFSFVLFNIDFYKLNFKKLHFIFIFFAGPDDEEKENKSPNFFDEAKFFFIKTDFYSFPWFERKQFSIDVGQILSIVNFCIICYRLMSRGRTGLYVYLAIYSGNEIDK